MRDTSNIKDVLEPEGDLPQCVRRVDRGSGMRCIGVDSRLCRFILFVEEVDDGGDAAAGWHGWTGERHRGCAGFWAKGCEDHGLGALI